MLTMAVTYLMEVQEGISRRDSGEDHHHLSPRNDRQ